MSRAQKDLEQDGLRYMPNFPLFPTGASSLSGYVDSLYFFLVCLTFVFGVGIALAIVFLAWRYRKQNHPKAVQVEGSLALELTWTIIPLGITMIIFIWAAAIYFYETRPPKDSMEVYVVAKQWMWKFEHTGGQREINVLHVPVGRDVRTIMTSQDVIHSFYVPAFRVKADVLPGRYTSVWFRATKVGTYHLFCAEYCGTQHSGMVGEVVVMDPKDYQAWAQSATDGSLASRGEKNFQQYGCAMCHRSDTQGRGPNLVGLYGHPVLLDDGRTVTADETYIRESIMNPGAQIASGFKNIMPTFEGQITEDEMVALVAYVKALGNGAANPPVPVSNPERAPYPVTPKTEPSVAKPDVPTQPATNRK
ncbi:MAG: cytochrome c oxidase subunit II [Terriglobia bacterium]|jgi:cytochrome c oxidase subunit 2|nr:cytochrome c oxidase subunit II [Terriglobia bacterium]